LAFVPFLMCDERQNFLTIAISDSWRREASKSSRGTAGMLCISV
jgi:hypothetical protein